MDAKDIASGRASQKAKLEPEAQAPQPAFPGVTSYQDLIERYKTDVIKTPSGLTFLIQTVNPGDYIAISGTPLVKYWTDKGVDFTDTEARMRSIDDMSEEKKAEMVLDADFQEIAKNVVCAGVYSLNLVNKPQSQAISDREELSVDLLPLADMFHLFTEIMKLSQGEEFAAELDLFREKAGIRPGEAVAGQDS